MRQTRDLGAGSLSVGAPLLRPAHARWGRSRFLVVACTSFGLIAMANALSACTSPAEAAERQATSDVREKAERIRLLIEGVAAGKSGSLQVEDVARNLTTPPLYVEAAGDGVLVTGAITARNEQGGGLSYEQFTARLCLEYAVTPTTGQTSVADIPCSAEAEAAAPANATVKLAE